MIRKPTSDMDPVILFFEGNANGLLCNTIKQPNIRLSSPPPPSAAALSQHTVLGGWLHPVTRINPLRRTTYKHVAQLAL
jgi:hypothetical protein